MSNEVKKRMDPFSGALSKTAADHNNAAKPLQVKAANPNVVGGNHGDRRVQTKIQEGAAQAPQASKPIKDIFKAKESSKDKLEQFESNASYAASKRLISSNSVKAFTPQKLFMLENGILPKSQGGMPYSDQQMLALLDEITTNPVLSNPVTIANAKKMAAAKVQNAKQNASVVPPRQKPIAPTKPPSSGTSPDRTAARTAPPQKPTTTVKAPPPASATPKRGLQGIFARYSGQGKTEKSQS